jgi:hypothetical protein
LLTNEIQPHAQHAGLVSQGREALHPVRFVNRNAGHDGEAARMPLHRLLRIVEPLAFERRRDDDDAVDARLVHHRDHSLDSERFRQLRHCTGNPRPLRGISRPHVNLRIDDQPARLRHRRHDALIRQCDPTCGDACKNSAA